MLSANHVIERLASYNYSTYSGVPCSFLKPLINGVINTSTLRYIPATSEGEAIGINIGAYLAGEKTVTMCQNSGFGNMVNPLSSLSYPFKIPTLLIVTWRGQPGLKDEPQHEQMGIITPKLFETLGIPWQLMPTSLEKLDKVLSVADRYMTREQRPYGLIMAKGTVDNHDLIETIPQIIERTTPKNKLTLAANSRLSRTEALECILETLSGDEAVVATTGKTGRELFELADKPNNIYVVGGMGTASAIGLGISSVLPDRSTVVLDGDGAALMKLGNLATIGLHQPKQLLHVVLDNGVHDSTGGQRTASEVIDFCAIAAATNYRQALSVDTPQNIQSALSIMKQLPGPHFLHIKTKPGSPKNLGRPNVTPQEVKERFMAFLANNVSVGNASVAVDDKVGVLA